jgi:hypothetical protein
MMKQTRKMLLLLALLIPAGAMAQDKESHTALLKMRLPSRYVEGNLNFVLVLILVVPNRWHRFLCT